MEIKSFKDWNNINESESLIINKVMSNLDGLTLKEKVQLLWNEILKNGDIFSELWEDALDNEDGGDIWDTFKSLHNVNNNDEWWSKFNIFQLYLLPVKQGGDYKEQNRFFLVADLFNLQDEFYTNMYAPDELSSNAKEFLINYDNYLGVPSFDKLYNYYKWLKDNQ